MSPPVLTMPDLDEDFVLECDTSKEGIEPVLMQNGHPIAYISQGLKGRAWPFQLMKKKCSLFSWKSKIGNSTS